MILKTKQDDEEQYKKIQLLLPDGSYAENQKVLLHACCAPCSAAIVECMLRNGISLTVFFCNPNIYPLDEYEIRKQELMRFLTLQNIPFVEDKYEHSAWLEKVKNLEKEPERGRRCLQCFKLRLVRTARYASENGFKWFATTLASSRWKNLAQINAAGNFAAEQQGCVIFWEQNWRKGGLQLRRNQLLKENAFYNQKYCGCEYSLAGLKEKEKSRESEDM